MQNNRSSSGFSVMEVVRFLGMCTIAVATICSTFPAQARADVSTSEMYAQNYAPPPSYPPPAYGQTQYAPPPMANPGDAASAVADGTADAQAQVSGVLWFFVGFILSWIGIILGYVITPSPDGARLIGKSPMYVQAYTEAYGSAGKSKQGIDAVWGAVTSCVLGVLFYVIFVVIIFGAAATSVAAAGA